jgi:AsmA protein
MRIDRLNVDKYIPADKKDGKGDEKVDLAVLHGKTVNGKVAIGSLTALRVKAENVKAEIKLADGKLEISPHSASLYGGTMGGVISADANGNRVHVKEDIKGVAVGPLLRDYARKDLLEGRGDIAFDVNAAGATTLAIKRALAGSARIQMKEGSIKGINLNDPMRNVRSALPMKSSKHDPSKKTDFSDLSATFAIKNGVAHNDDLKVQAALLRVGGAGNLDIGHNIIDYLAKATLAAGGVTIPVKLSGPLDNPNWNVDYTGLLGGAGRRHRQGGRRPDGYGEKRRERRRRRGARPLQALNSFFFHGVAGARRRAAPN